MTNATYLRVTQKVTNILRHIKQLAILRYDSNEPIKSLKKKKKKEKKQRVLETL